MRPYARAASSVPGPPARTSSQKCATCACTHAAWSKWYVAAAPMPCSHNPCHDPHHCMACKITQACLVVQHDLFTCQPAEAVCDPNDPAGPVCDPALDQYLEPEVKPWVGLQEACTVACSQCRPRVLDAPLSHRLEYGLWEHIRVDADVRLMYCEYA